MDWIRIDSCGIRRQGQRTQFVTDDRTLILMGYDALIRGDEEFTRARRAAGRPPSPSSTCV
jgi:hypothetical protein